MGVGSRFQDMRGHGRDGILNVSNMTIHVPASGRVSLDGVIGFNAHLAQHTNIKCGSIDKLSNLIK